MRHKKAAGDLAIGDTIELPGGKGIVGIHSVRSILRVRCGGMTISVQAESPTKPSRVAPQSIETMSPSFRMRSAEGMPWTISSLMEMHKVAGNGELLCAG